MSQRARSVGRDPLKRRRTHVYTGNRILIVTEGEKTEPLYLKKLRALLELNSAQVEVIHPEGTDPMTLVDYAIDRLATSRKQAKRGEDVAFDEAWVVFDLEQIHDERRDIAARARDRAEKHHIKVASSDPSFEFWLLLHFRQTTRPYPDCDSVTKDLRGCWPKYKKCSTPDDQLMQNIPTAVANAEFCRSHHEQCGGDGNPSTDMDHLARAMNDATREHLRLLKPS